MTECIGQLRLDFHPDLPVQLGFDAPQTSSDGGALLLRQVDDRVGVSEWFSALLPDERDPCLVQHDRREQVRQRLYQIALGYEDCNDADVLRHDPLLKVACDRAPKDAGLSSQPTLCRMENAVNMRAVKRLIEAFEDNYVASFDEPPETVVLDIDGTDDETHGAQQLSFFHGFYDHHMYHPLLVFDGQSGRLVTAILRPGNTHDSRGALPVLRRIIRKLKARFPSAQIAVRGDSGFCVPRVLEGLEDLDAELGGVHYLLGIAKNKVLLRLAEPAMQEAQRRYEASRQHVRHYVAFDYAAGTWPRTRHVVAKAEHHARGPNPRFVVTSLTGLPPDVVYRGYCQRGQAENFIKDLKNALKADRLSCSSFVANFFRLLEHAAAYLLMHALRTHVAEHSDPLGRAQFDTIRLRLLKVAAIVTQSVRRILVRLPRAFPLADIYRGLAAALQPLPPPAA